MISSGPSLSALLAVVLLANVTVVEPVSHGNVSSTDVARNSNRAWVRVGVEPSHGATLRVIALWLVGAAHWLAVARLSLRHHSGLSIIRLHWLAHCWLSVVWLHRLTHHSWLPVARLLHAAVVWLHWLSVLRLSHHAWLPRHSAHLAWHRLSHAWLSIHLRLSHHLRLAWHSWLLSVHSWLTHHLRLSRHSSHLRLAHHLWLSWHTWLRLPVHPRLTISLRLHHGLLWLDSILVLQLLVLLGLLLSLLLQLLLLSSELCLLRFYLSSGISRT